MMQRLTRLLFRDRRRFALSALLILASSIVGYNYVPDLHPLVPSEGVAMLALFAAMPIIAIRAPKYRFAIELAALSNLAFVVIGRLSPNANFNLANPDVNWLSATILYVLTILGVNFVIWGAWSDRIQPRAKQAYQAYSYSRLSVRQLWYGLVPTPGHLDECPDPYVVSIDYADPERRAIRMIGWMPPDFHSVTMLYVEEIIPLEYVRLRIEYGGDRLPDHIDGTLTFRIHDEGDRRRVEARHVIDPIPWRRFLRGVLDDTFGRLLDTRLTKVEAQACHLLSAGPGRASTGPLKSTQPACAPQHSLDDAVDLSVAISYLAAPEDEADPIYLTEEAADQSWRDTESRRADDVVREDDDHTDAESLDTVQDSVQDSVQDTEHPPRAASA